MAIRMRGFSRSVEKRCEKVRIRSNSARGGGDVRARGSTRTKQGTKMTKVKVKVTAGQKKFSVVGGGPAR